MAGMFHFKTKPHFAKEVVYGGRQEPTAIYMQSLQSPVYKILRFIPCLNAKSSKLLALENE